MDHPKRPIQTSVDAVVFSLVEKQLCVLLIRRNIEPFSGMWTLPGGFIDPLLDRDLEATVVRKLKEKTNVAIPFMEQLATVGNSGRDPRAWSVSVVYSAIIRPPDHRLAAEYGASDVCWEPITRGGVQRPLAFDHERLVRIAVDRLQSKAAYTSMAAFLLDQPFSMADLLWITEAILQRKVELKSLIRRYLGEGVLESVDEVRKVGRMRPARLYRVAHPEALHYFTRTLEGPRAQESSDV